MILEIAFPLLTIAIFVYWVFQPNQKGRNGNFLPKGPRGLPLIGNIHQLGEEPHKTFMEWEKEHGPIFSLQLGSVQAVVLNNYKDIREAFSNLLLCGRPKTKDLVEYCGGSIRGVLVNTGEVWHEQRRFVLKTLRDFGFGKRSVEQLVQVEVIELLDYFKEVAKDKKAFTTTHVFNAAVLNAIWSLVSGQRYSKDDPALHEAIETLTTFISETSQASVFFPWIENILSWLPGSYGELRQKMRNKMAFCVNKAISEHQESFQEEAEPRDFIDVYLKEIFRTTDSTSSFYGEEGLLNLCMCTMDLFLAGSETTSTTLSWIFLLLAMNPEKQDKLFEEIKQIVGLSRLPSLEDRPLMPYTEAVIMEVMRFSAIVPLSICHCATGDTTFKGYTIPKGTLIIPNIYAVMHDKSVWGDPDNFRPERFLSEDGKSVIKHEAWIPFSAGKRICIGMTVAMNELFLFTTSIFQRFFVGPDPSDKKGLKIDYHKATVLIPKPQNMRVYERTK